eukprot:1408929-Alexandrium_andersonii.AAC.1
MSDFGALLFRLRALAPGEVQNPRAPQSSCLGRSKVAARFAIHCDAPAVTGRGLDRSRALA